MNRSLLWRSALIVAIVGMGVYSAHPLEDISLGLDLRGGMHLVLRVKTTDALESEADKDLERLVQEARDGGLAEISANRTEASEGEAVEASSFEVAGVPPEQDQLIGKIANDYLPGWSWRREGARLRFEMRPENRRQIEELAVQQALQTIRNRVDAFGVAEPVIQRQGLAGDRIVVQLPGVDDPERVKRLIKNTAFLEFRLVTWPDRGAERREDVVAHFGGRVPDDVEILPQDLRDRDGHVIGQVYFGVQKRRVITGRDLKTARPSLGTLNEPVVQFDLTRDGGRRFAEVTGANVGRPLAIILDGRVVSAPRINERITDSGIITGRFTRQEVDDLATVLRSGALPAGIVYLEERTVGPSLGQDSIKRGIQAGIIGGALVVLAMIVVYRLTSMNAILALVLNVTLVFGALAAFGATLTLPGIAGIVLTIGMTVDANVLVFERIREELRGGRTVRSAVDAGFGKALSSILDANVTTLIAALFLFQFGTGPIRGFAVTLSVGILASLFTAVVVSRWLFDLVLSGRKRVERLSI
jgi:preprotein translocase subunit SecD